MALALPAEAPKTVTGECQGTLLSAPRGENGFGYDPLFLFETGKTFAELSQKEKNKVSHRAKAAAVMRVLITRSVLAMRIVAVSDTHQNYGSAGALRSASC